MLSREVPSGAAIIVLGPSGADIAGRARSLLPMARIHGPRRHRGIWDETYEQAIPHIEALFAAGTPIVGICASGILIRAIAPFLADKQTEPAVVALAEDGSIAVPVGTSRDGIDSDQR